MNHVVMVFVHFHDDENDDDDHHYSDDKDDNYDEMTKPLFYTKNFKTPTTRR